MYTGPHLTNEGLVFGYDTGQGPQFDPGVESRYYQGRPTTNYASLGAYSIYNTNATNYRNQSYPPPPSPGFEVVKVAVDSYGSYGHSILWNAGYPNNNVATISNSIYAWLEAGTYVQVGQHWYPWYYGTPKYIEKGKWVRINETYTINEGNSYGSAALAYSTDGVAYFSMPQFEYTSKNSPYVTGTRSTTNSLKDSKRTTTLDLSNVSFDSNSLPYFDGTNNRIAGNWPSSLNVDDNTTPRTWEVIVKPTSTTSWHGVWGHKAGAGCSYYCNGGIYIREGYYYFVWYDNAAYRWVNSGIAASTNQYRHVVATFASDGNPRIYVNGEYRAAWGSATQLDYSSGMIVYDVGFNSDNGGQHYFPGEIPVARFYKNKALSATEVKNNYLAYKQRFNLS